MNAKLESLTKAAQCSELLVEDIRQAHKGTDGALEMLLLDLLEDAARIKTKLARLAEIPSGGMTRRTNEPH